MTPLWPIALAMIVLAAIALAAVVVLAVVVLWQKQDLGAAMRLVASPSYKSYAEGHAIEERANGIANPPKPKALTDAEEEYARLMATPHSVDE